MMCDMPTPSSAPASYLPDLPPPSPRHRPTAYHMQPMNFDFNFNQPTQTADQQFQAQLFQRLQSLTGTIANTPTSQYQQQQQRLSTSYQPHLFAPPQHQPQPSVSPTINRVSQASSYCASPVTNRSTSGDSVTCCGNDGIIKPLSDDHQHQQQQHQQQQMVTVVVDRTAEDPPPEPAPTVLSPPPPGKQKSLLKVSSGGGGSSSKPGGGGRKTTTVVGNGPITRTTSEKVSNKSNLMSQVQRTTWARHTTKWSRKFRDDSAVRDSHATVFAALTVFINVFCTRDSAFLGVSLDFFHSDMDVIRSSWTI